MRLIFLLLVSIIPAIGIAQEHFQLPHEGSYTLSTEVLRGPDIERKHQIQLPDGTHISCTIVPTSVLENKVDYIRTYYVYKDDTFIGTYTWSTSGEWYYLDIEGKRFSIVPDEDVEGNHKLEYAKKEKHQCSTDHTCCDHSHHTQERSSRQKVTSTKKTFRIALVCTGEFYELNGGTMQQAMAVVTASIQGLNAVYLKELAVEFKIAGTPKIFTDRNTDPFDPNTESRPVLAGEVVNQYFSPSIYEIGHVLHRYEPQNSPWAGGGVARLYAVCQDHISEGSITKAQGWSGHFNTSGYSWISLFAHEVAHMFGATHTFNGIGGSCTENIWTTTSYEIGSGSTIMSYSGTCEESNNIQDGPDDLYFHVNSLMQMSSYIEDLATCPTTTTLSNTAPTVEANPDDIVIRIPKATPFYLNGQATDTDNDQLTYTWEQFDEDGPNKPTQGFIGTRAANDVRAPLFRSYPPSPESFRYFPRLSDVASGQINPFDVVSNKARDLKFMLTVRDNHVQGSAYTIDSVIVKVENSGPLTVDNQSTWNTGNEVAVTWKTNNSENLCDKVDIKLSLDGGNTFNFVIAENISYSQESYMYKVPKSLPFTDNAKIMISCVDNKNSSFFNMSARSFKVQTQCQVAETFICPTYDITADTGAPELNLTSSIQRGYPENEFDKNITNNSPQLKIYVNHPSSTSCLEYFNFVVEQEIIMVDKPGMYTFDVSETAGIGFVSLFENEGFNSTTACSKFIRSTATGVVGSQSDIFRSQQMSVLLEACKEYRLVFYTYDDRPSRTRCKISSTTGASYAISVNDNPTEFSYIAVNSSGVISKVSSSADFRDLGGGSYYIYSISYESSTDISSLEGQNFNDVTLSGCIKNSYNASKLNIESSCVMTQVEAQEPGACDPNTGTSTVRINTTYLSTLVANDVLHVGNQTFPASAGGQEISIIIPAQGERSEIVVYLASEPNCKKTLTIQQKENCCTFDIPLKESYVRCDNEELILDAGSLDGASYQWKLEGQDIAGATSQTIQATSGTYEVHVTNSTGCKKTARTQVVLDQSPPLNLLGKTEFCQGDMNTITAQTNADSIVWILNGTVIGTNTKTQQVQESGILEVTVTGTMGCSRQERLTLKTIEAPTINLGMDIQKCAGDSHTLSTDISGVYKWYKDNNQLPNTENTLTITESGVYVLEVTSPEADCPGRDTVIATFETIPELSVPINYSICQGDSAKIVVETNSANISFFEGSNTTASQSGSSKEFITSFQGSIRVVAGPSPECSIEKSTSITVNPIPEVNIGEDQIDCIGNEVLVESGHTEGVVWSFNGTESTNPSITITTSGLLTVTVTKNNCTATDSKMITFEEAPSLSMADTIRFCMGSSKTIEPTTNGNTYEWRKDGDLVSSSLSYEVSAEGIYTFTSSFDGQCPTTKNVTAVAKALPNIDFGQNEISLCSGTSRKISGPLGPYTYMWSKNGTNIGDEIDITVTEAGEYTLTVQDSDGCTSSKSIMVRATEIPTISLDTESFALCEGSSKEVSLETNGSSISWTKNDVSFSTENPKNIAITEGGVYIVTVENSDGCTNTAKLVVNIESLPSFLVQGNRAACEGDTTQLRVEGNASRYEWKNQAGEVISTDLTLTVVESAVLTLVAHGETCAKEEQIDVRFTASPSLTISDNSVSLCTGDTKDISISTDADSIQWYKNNLVIDGARSSTLTISSDGLYKAIVTNEGGCTRSVESVVQVFEKPSVNLGEDVELCPGDLLIKEVSLKASETVRWSDGSSAPIYRFDHEQKKELTITTLVATISNVGGCASSDTIIVTQYPVIEPVLTYDKTNLCVGDTILLSVVGGDTFEWRGPEGTFNKVQDDRILIYPTSDATYSVQAYSGKCPGSRFTAEVDIKVDVPADMTAGVDTCLVKGNPITLNASGGSTYKWKDDASITADGDTATPTVDPSSETVYTVMITDGNGCSIVDEVKVCVHESAEDLIKPISMITPNNDGINDVLIFEKLNRYKDARLEIYNRWGELIYAKEKYQQDMDLFDGNLGPDPLPADTYYYILTFDGLRIKSTLTIAR